MNLSGNELARNLSGNVRPQSSQLAEPLWIDPGIMSGICVRELIFTSKKEKKKKRKEKKEKKRKALAGSKWSNILLKSSQTRKKPTPPPPPLMVVYIPIPSTVTFLQSYWSTTDGTLANSLLSVPLSATCRHKAVKRRWSLPLGVVRKDLVS